MARESVITKEKVAAAVAELKEAGVSRPSAGRVREHLQKKFGPGERVGAQNKIQDFLNQLREQVECAKTPAASREMPASLSAEISRAMAGVDRQVREELRAAHELAVQELAEMTAESRQQSIVIDDLHLDLASRTTERDALTGELAMAAQELNASRAELLRQQGLLADLHLALARAEANVMNAAAQMEAKATETSRAEDALVRMRSELDTVRELHIEADRRAAVAQVQLAAETKACQTADGQLTQILSNLKEGENVASRAAAAEAASIELRAQVAVLQRLLERPRRGRVAVERGQAQRKDDRSVRPPLANV